jgi:hypothetical protein
MCWRVTHVASQVLDYETRPGVCWAAVVTPWMTGRRGSRHRAGGDEGGVVRVVWDRGQSSPELDYSARWVSGRDEGGFGKGFGLSLCAVPLTQLVPHLGWRFD